MGFTGELVAEYLGYCVVIGIAAKLSVGLRVAVLQRETGGSNVESSMRHYLLRGSFKVRIMACLAVQLRVRPGARHRVRLDARLLREDDRGLEEGQRVGRRRAAVGRAGLDELPALAELLGGLQPVPPIGPAQGPIF